MIYSIFESIFKFSPHPPARKRQVFLGRVEGKRIEYWGEGEYSTVVSLSTLCSPREIKERRVVHILKLHKKKSTKRRLILLISTFPIIIHMKNYKNGLPPLRKRRFFPGGLLGRGVPPKKTCKKIGAGLKLGGRTVARGD